MGMEGFHIANGPTADYGGSLTFSVILTCIMAASGGLIFGYDIGISGGVSSMLSFIEKFFPSVLRKMIMHGPQTSVYCLYDSQRLTAFTSSLYIAGLFASLVASKLSKKIGRQAIMLLGGIFFFLGAVLNAAAVDLAMLIIGRMFMGFGVGFTNQSTPVYLAEVSPPRWRGTFSSGFQFFLALGNLLANVVNFEANHIKKWGWRLSLGLAAAPSLIIVFGSLFISDTPSSLVLRGKLDDAKTALLRVRGPDADTDGELKEVIKSVEEAKQNEAGAFRRIMRREYRPHLVMAVAIPLFFQLTGVIVMAFFSPILFRTVGFGSNAALIGAVILGAVNLVATSCSSFTLDRLGRRPLFFIGGVIMVICQAAVAWIMGAQLGSTGAKQMSHGYSVAVVVLVCGHAAGFGMSWGPLNWLIPSEIFPLEVRSAGNGISAAVGLFCTFIQTQFFLSMLCKFKYGIFAYYAGWIVLMTAFIALFLPETKGVPLESMNLVWGRHWYWKRFIKERKDLLIQAP
ncbi:Sugar transport protein 5 [Rhynchospora pubera]|uniref:Sugar transport protein 5 n=2 Tax=Rhynchospora pubera TaxID=906938 RepID=A0AAV8DB71_9POAL|nr:Sugar transport protein 5 [Rhynchospora pubera]